VHKGLGSKTVNYSLSNKRELVQPDESTKVCCSNNVWLTYELAELHVCHAERNGIRHVPLGATLLCLDDCSCGELDELIDIFALAVFWFCFDSLYLCILFCNAQLQRQAAYALAGSVR